MAGRRFVVARNVFQEIIVWEVAPIVAANNLSRKRGFLHSVIVYLL